MTDPAPTSPGGLRRTAVGGARAAAEGMPRSEREAVALGLWEGAPGVVPFVYVDGPNGVRGADGATAFPSPLAVAASFDVGLAERYGRALARETRAAGANVLLGPVLDVARVPRDGRTGEGLGEDPELVAQIGGAIIDGIQAERVLPVVKHLVANNAEVLRTGENIAPGDGTGPGAARTGAVDVIVDERTLREVYLWPFERAVRAHRVAGLMSSYNRVNGEYPAQSPEIWRMVREEWGFEGVTLPDFLFAVRDDEAALRAGLDLPALGPAHGRTAEMVAALADDDLNELVSHVVRAARLVRLEPAVGDPSGLGTPLARDLARDIVTAGTVLLANDGTLPLASGVRVAVVSPDSLDHLLIIGGSAAVEVDHGRSPSLTDALRAVGIDAYHVRTAAADTPVASEENADGFAEITAVERDSETGVATVRQLDTFAVSAEDMRSSTYTAEITGSFTARLRGEYRFTLDFAGSAELFIDGGLVTAGSREASPMIGGPHYPLHHLVDMDAGETVAVDVRYRTGAALSAPGTPLAPFLSLGVLKTDDRTTLIAAVEDSDVVIAVVGRASGEAMDVESLRLPEDQVRVLEALTASSRVVLVTLGSGPLVLSHLPFAAILHGWQAGEAGTAGLAQLIAGDAEPRGRLPLSFPASEEDVAFAADGYPGVDGRTVYSEGVNVGYRGYEAGDRASAFPFGFGLGYAAIRVTSVAYRVDGDAVTATAQLRNTSERAGGTVVQLYGGEPDSTAALLGFVPVELAGNGDRSVTVRVAREQVKRWSPEGWQRVSGDFRLFAGLSSADRAFSEIIRLP